MVENIDDMKAGAGNKAAPKVIGKPAKKEGHKKAEISFNWANQVEVVHHKLYTSALEAAENGKDLPVKDVYVCQVCGMTVEGEAPDTCPVCNAKKEKFKKIE